MATGIISLKKVGGSAEFSRAIEGAGIFAMTEKKSLELKRGGGDIAVEFPGSFFLQLEDIVTLAVIVRKIAASGTKVRFVAATKTGKRSHERLISILQRL